ncbi:MAG: 3'(2'),5'-bisphosphate nucleotidase CysQ [Rhizobiaceae bacterium]|nr:3'(2'),5'-bisphosphate nucleotidase CysQ [Rhizobiaceae bacterium]
MTAPRDESLLAAMEEIAREAAGAVLRAFREGCAVGAKADASPVTEADIEAERIILAGLRRVAPDIPVIAEEEVAAGRDVSDPGDTFFLVDPLDGTREFVSGRGEFTVNIALVRGGLPVLGVVLAPVSAALFSGRPGMADKAELNATMDVASRRRIFVRQCGPVPTIVASRSHGTSETDRYLAQIRQAEIVYVGSSLKFCMIAAGEADIYPRFGRTMQWDTAAGDAVLRAAGGAVRTLDGTDLGYGPRGIGSERYANTNFIAIGAGVELPVFKN